MESIHALCVLPYENMRQVIEDISLSYPEINLDFAYGDRESGLKAVKRYDLSLYDVILSRGGTALLLRENVSIPVVEIPTSEHDILRALHMAENFSSKIAIIASQNITRNARFLSEFVSADLDIFTVNNSDEIDNAVRSVANGKYGAVLCDAGADSAAVRAGLNAILITSDSESIKTAFDNALQLHSVLGNFQSDNRFLRMLISSYPSDTVVFDHNKNLLFSTLNDKDYAEIEELLKSETDAHSKTAPGRVLKSVNGTLYNIREQNLWGDNTDDMAFFISKNRSPATYGYNGINYYTSEDALTLLSKYIDCFASINTIKNMIDNFASVSQPITITGEDGVGKDLVALFLYAYGPRRNHPLIWIDFSEVNDKTWKFLYNSPQSPFAETDLTIYISYFANLSSEDLYNLIALLEGMHVCDRNHMIFSCTLPPDVTTSETLKDFSERFNCINIYLQPLRKQKDQIPTLIYRGFNDLNSRGFHEVIGMEPDAMTLMQNYYWPHNYMQFERVLTELATQTRNSVITTDCVKTILDAESNSPSVYSHERYDVPDRFDLNRTLDEMETDIIKRVVAECNGNQTEAAKRLGISRTTLWRFLNR